MNNDEDLRKLVLAEMCEMADCPVKCDEPFESCTFLSRVDKGVALLRVYCRILEKKGLFEKVIGRHINMLLSEIFGDIPHWYKQIDKEGE